MLLARLNPHYSFCMSGSGLLWGWGFLHFFLSQSSPVIGGNSLLGDLPYLGSTLLVSFVVAVTASKSAERTRHTYLAYSGCLLLVVGILLDSVTQAFYSDASELHLLANIALGGGIGLFWIAWGCLYVRAETESVEYAFMGWFPLLPALLAIAAGISLLGNDAAILYTALLVLLPCTSLICFRVSERRIGAQDGNNALLGEYSSENKAGASSGKSVAWQLINLVCVFAAISLAWHAFLYHIDLDFEMQIALLAFGVTILFLVIWLALRLTRHFSLSTLYRWALPLMAVGIVLHQFSGAIFIAPVFLCLSIVNSGFEVMGKLFCIYIAKRRPSYTVSIISIGFATATLGGLIGTNLWRFVLETFGADAAGNTLLVTLVVFVIAASIALGKDDDVQDNMRFLAGKALDETNSEVSLNHSTSEKPLSSASDTSKENRTARCRAIAEKFGLSARELDVLILLSQGRSRAHIRETLYISKGTVDSHIHHIYSKIGVASKDELMRYLLD